MCCIETTRNSLINNLYLPPSPHASIYGVVIVVVACYFCCLLLSFLLLVVVIFVAVVALIFFFGGGRGGGGALPQETLCPSASERYTPIRFAYLSGV